MGDWYEVRMFKDTYYLEFCSEQTEWKSDAVELSNEDLKKIEDFQFKQLQESNSFLKQFLPTSN